MANQVSNQLRSSVAPLPTTGRLLAPNKCNALRKTLPLPSTYTVYVPQVTQITLFTQHLTSTSQHWYSLPSNHSEDLVSKSPCPICTHYSDLKFARKACQFPLGFSNVCPVTFAVWKLACWRGCAVKMTIFLPDRTAFIALQENFLQVFCIRTKLSQRLLA